MPYSSALAQVRRDDEIVLINADRPAIDEAGVRTRYAQGGHLSRELFRVPEIVRVDRCDPLPVRLGKRAVASYRDALVSLANKPQPWLESSSRFDDLDRSVGGTVVHHDDFDLSMGLRYDRSDRAFDEACGVVGRDDNGNEPIARQRVCLSLGIVR